jgi:hypothetical protein
MSRSIARWSCGISLWSAALNLGLCTPWRFALFFPVLRVPKLRVPELVPGEIARKSHYKIGQAAPMHVGMVVVGVDYGHAGQMTLDEITGGSPSGATTIAGGLGH